MGWKIEWSAGRNRRLCLDAQLYRRLREKTFSARYNDSDQIMKNDAYKISKSC
jgi:hypothetical protein